MVGLNFFRVACTGSHAAVRTFAPAFRACVPAFNGKRPIAIMCHAPMCGGEHSRRNKKLSLCFFVRLHVRIR